MVLLFYSVLLALPFGAKFLVYQFTPGFHEYEAAFVYLNDVALVFFLISFAIQNLAMIRGGKFKTLFSNFYFLISVFLLFAVISVFFAPSKGLAIYSFIRLLAYVLFAFAAGKILSDKKNFERALAILAALAVLQSLIGIWQFKTQDDLGVQVLGEPPIGAFDPGTSKVFLDGMKFVRAYGAFPHPNALAAFLILGLCALYYFWLKRPSERKFFSGIRTALSDAVIGIGIFAVSLGLLFTFSRTGWAIALAATAFISAYAIIARARFIQGVRLAVLSIAIFGILVFNFNDYIFPRAQISRTEPAVTQRLAYNDLALQLIKEKPFGVGIGNQVLYSVKNGLYQKLGMNESWQWQPIHNIYLFISSEIGVLGATSFLLFIAALLISNFKFLIPNQTLNPKVQNSKIGNSTMMLLALLLFGLTDHFLWTLPQGQLMLWLAIGFTLASARSPDVPV